ncbi:MAG: hypothetical protein ACYCPT_09215 [Acidimicrobiales bacterium]
MGFQFISVRQNAPEFKSTAEVIAEEKRLLAVQGVTLNCRGSSERTKTTEELLKYRTERGALLRVQGVTTLTVTAVR